MKPKNLKLIARTEEDLRVVSAHLQDSIASVSDIANLKKNKIFLMQLNRFMWEDVEKGVFRKNKRIRTILKFENVFKILSKNINQLSKDKFLDFLAIETNVTPDNNYEMKIIFAGDSIIKVISEVIEVTLDDQGEAWDTKNKPKHQSIIMLKTLNYNNQNSLKILELFLDKRKSIQKNQTSAVSKIIKNVKKNGDKAVLNYEKKFSKIKKKQKNIFFK